jgi:hypothetical protein
MEKVINNHIIALSKVDKKRFSYKRERARLQHAELYDSIKALQDFGISVDEIGRFYVDFLSKNEPSKILAKLRSTKTGLELEKVKRIIKREIQKDTRAYFARITENLGHRELKPEEIVPDPDIDILQARFGLRFKKPDTIEGLVNNLLITCSWNTIQYTAP